MMMASFHSTPIPSYKSDDRTSGRTQKGATEEGRGQPWTWTLDRAESGVARLTSSVTSLHATAYPSTRIPITIFKPGRASGREGRTPQPEQTDGRGCVRTLWAIFTRRWSGRYDISPLTKPHRCHGNLFSSSTLGPSIPPCPRHFPSGCPSSPSHARGGAQLSHSP